MFGELCACSLFGHMPFGKSKNFDFVTDAAQSVMSDEFPAFGRELDEGLTGKSVAIKRFGKRLNTCGFVRGGSNDAKLDVFRHTDISIKNFANMQPSAKRDIGFSFVLSSLVDGDQSFVCLVKRGDSGFRGRLSSYAVVDRKYCKYSIADEPQNFTAIGDGAGRDLEIIVQGEWKLGLCRCVGKRCGTAQIAESDDRIDFFTVAKTFLTFQDPLAGAASEIGVQNILCDLFLDCNFAGDRKPLLSARQITDFPIAKALWMDRKLGSHHAVFFVVRYFRI